MLLSRPTVQRPQHIALMLSFQVNKRFQVRDTRIGRLFLIKT